MSTLRAASKAPVGLPPPHLSVHPNEMAAHFGVVLGWSVFDMPDGGLGSRFLRVTFRGLCHAR
jgi:hypothetical protein